MAYQIITKSVKDFIGMPTKLPRFQRKKTWNALQNFNLCISIFKNYPIGVVVINNNNGGYWVLDGRQRLEAMTQMSTNPEVIYDWAAKFVKFKQNDDEDIITQKFFRQISNYLDKSKSDMDKDDVETQSLEEEDFDTELCDINDPDMSSFSSDEQEKNFRVLLDMILMIHKRSAGKSKWQRQFDFTPYFDRLPYYGLSNGQQVFQPTNLTKEIHKIINHSKIIKGGSPECPLVSVQTFIDYFGNEINGRYINEKAKREFEKRVRQNWNGIYHNIETINKADKIMRDSIIGIIELTKASDLDAQNIFELINKGGTILTAEELLSAKPYWNLVVNNPSKEAIIAKDELYGKLDVEPQDNVVRWDLCATLISRLPKANFIFGNDKELLNEKNLRTFTTLGFKLFSAIKVGGINSVSVASIENKRDFDWETQYETFVVELNQLCELIGSHSYFRYMKNWKVNLRTLLSDAISLEFLALIYRKWVELGKPLTDSSAEGKAVKRNAVILADKLIYEYSCGMWRGSSDSKLSNDLQNMTERLSIKNQDDWLSLINSQLVGRVNDRQASQKDITPILYHSLFLSGTLPMESANPPYQVDHIYPQAIFKDNTIVSSDYRDSITNLQVLSAETNNLKKDKKLNEITDSIAREEIARASHISIDEFEKYSSISNIEDLKELRADIFKYIFTKKRMSILSSEK